MTRAAIHSTIMAKQDEGKVETVHVRAVNGRMFPDYAALEGKVSILRYVGYRFNRTANDGNGQWDPLPDGEVLNVRKDAIAALVKKGLQKGDLEPMDAATARFAGLQFKKTR